MGSKSKFKSLRIKLLGILERMGTFEKIVFLVFALLLATSALLLMKRASDLLSIEIPVNGGILREGAVGYPRYINPLLSITDTGKDLSNLVFSGLLKTSTDGSLKPDLAKSYTVSDDGLHYTFILKDDIYFHDNTPLTAYDVEFTVRKVTDPILKSPKAVNWSGVTVKAIDAKTVEFTLKKPYAPFVENLTLGILPSHIWKEVSSDAYLFSELNFSPIGSGPYKIEEIKRKASGLPTYYRLAPFKKYALGEPYISDLYIYFYGSEEEIILAYQNGEIDSINSISPTSASSIDSNRSVILKTPLPRSYAAFINQSQSKILADKGVREALRLSTPKQAIIEMVMLGFASPIESPLPESISALSKESQNDTEGLEAGKMLLAKAGWTPDAGTLIKKDTKGNTTSTLSFSISTANVAELKATAELLKTTWQSLGAKVEVKIFDSADLEQTVIVPRQFDILLFGESTGRNVDLFPFWHSSERNFPGLNIVGYANSKADKYLADARATSDEGKRIELYRSFEKEIYADIPAIFLYSPDLIYVVPKRLKGISFSGITNASERFTDIEKWYMETESVWQIPWINK